MSQPNQAYSKSILFLDHAEALGGAERSLLLLLQFLDRREWELHLAGQNGPLLAAAAALNIRVHKVAMPRLRSWTHGGLSWLSGANHIRKLIKQTGVDYLHANTVRSAFYASLASVMTRAPWIWHMRDFSLSESPSRLRLVDQTVKGLLCLTTAQLITNSYSVAEHMSCSSKITVVHNGIDVTQFKLGTGDQAFRNAYGVPEQAPIVGAVGRLRPWKGQDRFLRAMKTVADSEPGAWFLIVGGTPFEVGDDYAEHLRQLAGDLGIADRVVFTGHLEDVRPALSSLDVFVHAGDPEPFGLVVLEAMAMTKPIVAFGHGALPEIVVDGESGILVRPTDEGALSSAVLKLLREPDLRTRLGKAARGRVEGQFTAERMAAAVSSVYRELAGKR